MLRGKTVRLRPVQEQDLDFLYQMHTDIENRGDFFPVGVSSEPDFRRNFQETGFWEKNAGKLLIVGGHDTIIGHIEFFPTVSYLDEIELAYHIYSSEHYGKGIATEAVQLMTGYLFNRLKVNRIRLIIHPDNLASQRVAAKSGFTHESTARGAWFHKGKSQDVEVFALLREEFSVK